MENEKMADEATMANEATNLYQEVDHSIILNEALVLAKMEADGVVRFCALATQTGKMGFGETQDSALLNLQWTFRAPD